MAIDAPVNRKRQRDAAETRAFVFLASQSSFILRQMVPLRDVPLTALQWWQLHQDFLLEHPMLEPKPTLKQYEYEAVRVEFERHETELSRVNGRFSRDDEQSRRARDDAMNALATQLATRRRHPAKFRWEESEGEEKQEEREERGEREEEKEEEGSGEEDGRQFTTEQSAWILEQMEPYRATPLTKAQWRHLFKVFMTRFPKSRGVVSLTKYQTHASKLELVRDTDEFVQVATTRPPTRGITAQYQTDRKRLKATSKIKKEILLRDRPSRYAEDTNDQEEEEEEEVEEQVPPQTPRTERQIATSAAPPPAPPAFNGLPLFTEQQRRWIRSQLSRFPRIPTTDVAWKALLKAFRTEFPDQRGWLTVKQYTDEAIRIDRKRHKEEMQRQEERHRRLQNQAEWFECVEIKEELQRREDHTFQFLTRESDEEDPDIQQIWQQPRPDETKERLAAAEASAQQWKTKYETEKATSQRVRARLAARDEELKAAQERVQKLESVLAMAEEKVQQVEAAAPEPPPRPQATATETTVPPEAPVAEDPIRQSANGVTFVLNLNLGDIMRAASG